MQNKVYSVSKMKSIVLVCLCVASALAVPLTARKPLLVKNHLGERIVGGEIAATGQFPWQVAVYFDTPEGTYFCGGALIAPNWVLTAGHCTYHATVFTLHLGANSLVDDDPNRVTLGASHSVAHPDYVPEDLQNDIGLVRIDSNITLNEYIQLIALESAELGGGQDVIVSGWGATGDWDGATNDLYFVGLKSITNTECKAIYGEHIITDGMVCAVGPSNEGTCNGDSGGPLVVEDANGNAIHVGIVSWAASTGCETNHPSGYTRTSHYIDWINSVVA